MQVLSRQVAHAEILAKKTGASYGDLSTSADDSADIIIIAVSDKALAEENFKLITGGKLVVHTAGSVTRRRLDEISSCNGILYPLQTLRKEMAYVPEIPFLIDGSDDASLARIRELAESLSGKVSVADDEARIKLHAAAVIVNNFTNHLYVLAEDFCKKEALDFSLLLPLIKETAARISFISPAQLQTGPAVRNDIHTIHSHLEILEKHGELRELYQLLTAGIRSRHS